MNQSTNQPTNQLANRSTVQFCVYPQFGQPAGWEQILEEESHSAQAVGFESLVRTGELLALFRAGAFWAQDRTEQDLHMALSNSKPMVTARLGDRLVGFARATSDGVYRGTIWDVVVHPEVQGQGIGRRLVETLLSHPHLCRVERVYLMTTYQEKFYERIGFQRNGSTTMVLHNHALYNNTADVGVADVGVVELDRRASDEAAAERPVFAQLEATVH